MDTPTHNGPTDLPNQLPQGLHCEEAGNPTGPPVLLLHGFMSSNYQWDPNRHGLGAELRLLLTEQPGHGSSPGPDNVQAYRANTILEQLDRIRSDRGIERWWLLGQSLGGAVAMRYALRYPDRVHGLVFTNSRAVFGLVGKGVPEKEPERDSERESEKEPGRDTDAGKRSAAQGGRRPELTREQIRAMPYHPINAKRIPAELKAKMVAAADAMPSAPFRHLAAGGPWRSTEDLHRLEVPTLLINGRFEEAFQPCVEQARAGIADLTVVNLDGGHSVNIDQPEQFNRAVLDFIGSRPS